MADNFKGTLKKKRSRNWTEAEKMVLAEAAARNRYILENKESNNAAWKEKHECWKRIAIELSHVTGSSRDGEACLNKYNSLKTDIRKKRRESGINQKISLDAAELIVDDIMGFDIEGSEEETNFFNSPIPAAEPRVDSSLIGTSSKPKTIARTFETPRPKLPIIPTKKPDEVLIFSQYIAMQLKDLPKKNRLILQDKIQSLIFDERLKLLENQSNLPSSEASSEDEHSESKLEIKIEPI